MPPVVWAVLIIILIIAWVLFLVNLRTQSVQKLHEVLYVNHDLTLYRQLLENRRLSFIFSKGTMEHFRLEGYLYAGEDDACETSFEKLKGYHFNVGEKQEIASAGLSYYCQKGNAQQARYYLDQLSEALAKSKKPEDREMLEDSKMIYRIYIDKEAGLIEPLRETAHHQKGVQKAITLYRIARLQYANGQDTKKTLEEALPYAKGTGYQPIIQDALKDPQHLG